MIAAGDEPVAVPAAAHVESPVVKMDVPAPKPVEREEPAPIINTAPAASLVAHITAPAASLVAHIKQSAPALAPVSSPAPAPAAASVPAGNLQEIWAKVIGLATGRSQKTLLNKLALESVGVDTAVVGSPHESFEMAQVAEPEIEASLVNILGRRVKVEIRDTGKSTETAPIQQQSAAPSMTQVESNPLIKRATELFGARIVSVQPRRPSGAAATPPTLPAAPRPSEEAAPSGDE